MLSIAKSLVAACVFLMFAGSASINAAAPGFLEGHLKIVSLNEVEPADEMPRQSVTAEVYTEYPR